VRLSRRIFVACLLFSSICEAQEKRPNEKKRVHWDPAWTHANAWDYTLTGVGVTAIAIDFAVFQPMRPPVRWTNPILFDADVRSAMRVSDAGTRSSLENAAWGLWIAQMAYPFAVDVPYAWVRYGRRVAWDLFWQSTVTLAVAGTIDAVLRDVSGRIRPDVYDCYISGRTDCLSNDDSTRSFPGGHLINSAAAAGLVCTQHLYMRLYGAPWDAVTCASTITASFTLAMFRIMSDNHWATDQIVGGALGGFIGWFVPWVMHLRGHATSTVMPIPIAFDRGGGAGVVAAF
jgi:membrane-associated phospholipid phosphatase